jgi:hypothetical protein
VRASLNTRAAINVHWITWRHVVHLVLQSHPNTERHRLQGIGGVVKLKHKKQVRVGKYAKLCRDEKKKSIQHL